MEFNFDFLRDLELILAADEEYFFRYDQKNDEVITNLFSDSIYYFDMTDKEDRTKLINYLMYFMKKHYKEYAIKNRNLNLELR